METKRLLLLFLLILVVSLESSATRRRRSRYRRYRTNWTRRSRISITGSRPTSCTAEFNYNEDSATGKGPSQWSNASSCYEKCRSGSEQSPINLDSQRSQYRGAMNLDFNYRDNWRIALSTTNRKNLTPKLEADTQQFDMKLDGTWYDFSHVEVHFGKANENMGSEHSMDGNFFDMEAQMVFKAKSGYYRFSDNAEYVIVGVGLQVSTDDALAATDCETLSRSTQPDSRRMLPGSQCIEHLAFNISQTLQCAYNNSAVKSYNSGRTTRMYIDLNDLIPHSWRGRKHFFAYRGSLTEPPCTESVQWLVLRCPVTVSIRVLEALQSIEATAGGEVLGQWGTRRPIQSNTNTVLRNF